MKLAILFWFYKELYICRNRLALLRRLNPDTRIYGLFAGELGDAPEAGHQLAEYLDDLYIFENEGNSDWKWHNGDLVIAQWYKDRGHKLAWESIVVVQWDMLVLGPVDTVFGMLRPGEMLLSGLRPASDVRAWWPWLLDSDPVVKQDRDDFISYLRETHKYSGDLLCCLFIVVCLPRLFLELYLYCGPPKVGFLEYKVPTLAHVFGIPFCKTNLFGPWWARDPSTKGVPPRSRLLNAVGDDVLEGDIDWAARTGHVLVFHPYRKLWPPAAQL